MSDFNAKVHQIRFPLDSAPDPLAGFKAPTSKGREAKMEGRGRMESGEWRKKMRALLLRKGKKELDRREGREEEGICRTNVKVLPTPLREKCMAYRQKAAAVVKPPDDVDLTRANNSLPLWATNVDSARQQQQQHTTNETL